MKDLVLDDVVDLLNLEYRSGAGFENLFHMITTSFEVSKCDTRMRSWSTTMASALHSSTRLPL